MGFESVIKVGAKAVTQVTKKTYVKPACEFRTMESLGLKMEQLTGDSLRLNLPEFRLSADLEQRLCNITLKEKFNSSFREFFYKKNLHITHESNPIIKEGDMLHGMYYEPESVRSVLKDGIMSGEVSVNSKKIICEDGETFGCADFFTAPKTMHVGEYFSSFVNRKFGIRQAPERAYLPREIPIGRGSRQIAYVIDSEKFKTYYPVLHKNSATPNSLKGSPIEGFIHHFVDYDNLKAVLIGVPSNCISKIVIGKGLKPEEINSIKNAIRECKLDIELYDISGNII